MKIDNVIAALQTRRHHLRSQSRECQEPRLVVYMSNSYYRECLYEIRGAYSPIVDEFYRSSTITGYPVYAVINGVDPLNHPPFIIVEAP